MYPSVRPSHNEMKTTAAAAARKLAERGGAEVRAVTLVGEPARAIGGAWLLKVRLMMLDGTARAFECDATDREVFAVREVTA
jgi:hypothetical protein